MGKSKTVNIGDICHEKPLDVLEITFPSNIGEEEPNYYSLQNYFQI